MGSGCWPGGEGAMAEGGCSVKWCTHSHPAGPQCPLDRKHQFKCPARFESTQGLGGGQVGDGGNNRQGWTGEVTSRDGLGDQTARWEDNVSVCKQNEEMGLT